MLGELGISAGTAIVVLIIFYFVIKGAVKNGIIAAVGEMEEGGQSIYKLLQPTRNKNEEESGMDLVHGIEQISTSE